MSLDGLDENEPFVREVYKKRIRELEDALKPFADHVEGIEPNLDGMRIAFGMLSSDDKPGWRYSETGLRMSHFINARETLKNTKAAYESARYVEHLMPTKEKA